MDITPATSNGPSPGDLDNQNKGLACQACQRKKIKCDRTSPCGQCKRSNLYCTPSIRKQRARHANRRAVDTELKSRIAKLETLVESLSGDVDDQNQSNDEPPINGTATNGDIVAPHAPARRYIGSDFWADIASEVQALRDALDEDEPEDEQSDSPAIPETQQQDFDLILCPPGSVYVMPGALPEATPQQVAILCDEYCGNVDRMIKVFHVPTLHDFVLHGAPYLGQDESAPCNKALKAAICFAALTTMSEEAVFAGFGRSKGDQLKLSRRWVDISFAQADLLNTNDIATVQAMVAYTATARMIDLSRRPWTMIALIIRVARAMNLHHDSTTATPFMKEIRRRLWQVIRVLDTFAAVDRGTEPLIAANSYTIPTPTNLNDSDFSPSSTANQITARTGLTEMAVAQIAHASSLAFEILSKDSPPSKKGADIWEDRLAFARQTGDWLQQNVLQYCSPTDPWQRAVIAVGNATRTSILLRAIRPTFSPRIKSQAPPRVESPWVLQISVDCLREARNVYEAPETRWRWMVWVPWHALACALAGLCSMRDTELSGKAWEEVESAYRRYGKHVADSEGGMLWRPIQKLYRRACAFRDEIELSPGKGLNGVGDRGKMVEGAMEEASVLRNQQIGSAQRPEQGVAAQQKLPDFGLNNLDMTTNNFQQMDMNTDPTWITPNGLSFDGMAAAPPLQYFDPNASNMIAADHSWLDWEQIMSDFDYNDTGVNGADFTMDQVY